jgi:hypothetical protein
VFILYYFIKYKKISRRFTFKVKPILRIGISEHAIALLEIKKA